MIMPSMGDQDPLLGYNPLFLNPNKKGAIYIKNKYGNKTCKGSFKEKLKHPILIPIFRINKISKNINLDSDLNKLSFQKYVNYTSCSKNSTFNRNEASQNDYSRIETDSMVKQIKNIQVRHSRMRSDNYGNTNNAASTSRNRITSVYEELLPEYQENENIVNTEENILKNNYKNLKQHMNQILNRRQLYICEKSRIKTQTNNNELRKSIKL